MALNISVCLFLGTCGKVGSEQYTEYWKDVQRHRFLISDPRFKLPAQRSKVLQPKEEMQSAPSTRAPMKLSSHGVVTARQAQADLLHDVPDLGFKPHVQHSVGLNGAYGATGREKQT